MFSEIHFEVILTSAIIYFFIIIGIRVFGKHELSQLSVVDLVFIMLLSNAVETAMVGSDATFWDGLLGAATLFLLNKIFKIFLFKSEKFKKLMDGQPIILIRHGKLNKKDMDKNNLSIRELEEACREKGEGDLQQIDLAILEVDGKISILSDKKIKKGSEFDIAESELE